MPILVLEHSDRARCNRLGGAMRDIGHRLDIRRLHHGESVPTSLKGLDGVIATGGPMAPDDDSQPWMAAELNLLRAAVGGDLPVVGICLGCQLLARALGGSVEARPQGQRIGWHNIDLTPTGRDEPLLAGLPWTWMQVHWNSWQIATLPDSGRPLATGPDGDIQIWKSGVRAYGFQCHPEVTRDTIACWIDDEPEAIAAADTTAAAILKATDEQWPQFERLTDRLFQAIALLLFPLETRNLGSGLIPEIHH